MAEFQEVIQQWKRMCMLFDDKSEKQCIPCRELCPVGSNPVCGDLTEATQKDMEVFEMTVMKWAAENPEPIYPTWIDWLIQQGIVPTSYDVINSSDPDIRAARFFVTSKAFKRIPEDIAKVLVKNAQK